MTATEKDRDILARALWGEARGELAQARIAADQVIDGKVPDPTGGATHYYTTTMSKPPAWVKGAKLTLKLGRHLFFKDVP
ncbi:Cell Wall Hydrolase [compost metagenome]